ncbi:DoxX family membrane protein [Candidatus Parcubacteria bacterium]|nr:DoxX family membrane protein [Candidatus Parcubacteria bacterium]
MLNPFPIQFLALFAYLILRFFVGTILVYFGYTHLVRKHELPFPAKVGVALAAVELVSGAMLVLGFYTQIAALAVMLLSLLGIIFAKRLRSAYIQNALFYTLLLATALSLFITGGGVFAFDLPI